MSNTTVTGPSGSKQREEEGGAKEKPDHTLSGFVEILAKGSRARLCARIWDRQTCVAFGLSRHFSAIGVDQVEQAQRPNVILNIFEPLADERQRRCAKDPVRA